MRIAISIILSIALLIASCVVAFAATYYIDPTCTYNGNGQASGCAASAGASGAYNCASGSSIYTGGYASGSDIYIKAGTNVNRCRIRLGHSGTSGDHVIVSKYGEGENPVLSSWTTQADSWTLATGAIYYATNTLGKELTILTVNGTRLVAIPYTTNDATTQALMSAGTYYTNVSTNRVYLWMADGSSPSGDTVKYADNSSDYWVSLLDTQFSDLSYIDVSNINFEGAFYAGAYLGYGTGSCDNCSFTNVSSTLTGGRGFFISGNNAVISNNTCGSASSEVNMNVGRTGYIDAGCIVMSSPSDRNVSGGVVHDNVVTGMIKGSCYEVNGDSGGARLQDTQFYDNEGYGCTHQGIEVWYSDNTIVERNLVDNTGYADKIAFEKGIIVGNTSSGTIVRNNIVVNFNYAGVAVGESSVSPNNVFYNNTCYSNVAYTGTYSACFSDASTSTTASDRNVFKNNVAYLSAGGYIQNSNKNITEYDKNIGYSASGNKYKWNNTNYTFENYLTQYTSDTSRTDNSLSQDPDINWTTYYPNEGSVSIGFGLTTLGVTDDYYGVARDSEVDAGAVEYITPELTLNVTLRNAIIRTFSKQ